MPASAATCAPDTRSHPRGSSSPACLLHRSRAGRSSAQPLRAPPVRREQEKGIRVSKGFVTTLMCVAFLMWSAATLPTAMQDQKTISRVGNPPPSSDLVNLPGDLRAIVVPEPSNLADFVRNP